jgi:NADPH:quinone reductase-like Zn-dependent oxidoreductase
MRAVVYDRYGPPDVLRLEDVAKPVPGEDDVLIKIHATTVNRLDCATRDANRRSGPAVSLLSWRGRSKPSVPPSPSSRWATTSSERPG